MRNQAKHKEEPYPKGRQGFVYSGDRPTSLFNHLALIDLSVLLGSKFKKPHFPKLEVLIRSKEVFAHTHTFDCVSRKAV